MILSFRTLGAEHTLHGSAQGCRVLQLVITITVILGSCARGVNKVQQCRGGFFSPLFIRMSDLRFIGSVSETRVSGFLFVRYGGHGLRFRSSERRQAVLSGQILSLYLFYYSHSSAL